MIREEEREAEGRFRGSRRNKTEKKNIKQKEDKNAKDKGKGEEVRRRKV